MDHGQNKTGQTEYPSGAVPSIKYDRNYRQTIVNAKADAFFQKRKKP
jgi:hypothetical protein